MQKTSYLKYFRNTESTRKLTQQSHDQSLIHTNESHYEIKNIQDVHSDQVRRVEQKKKQHKGDYHEHPQTEHHKTIGLQNKQEKIRHFKSIRVQNKTAKDIKRRKQTEENQEAKKDFLFNLRNCSTQLRLNSFIEKGHKLSKLMAISLHNPAETQKSNQTVIQHFKNLQSSSVYDPCLGQQKFFIQPIKPYDRNKTARNKKFKTLKTAFGDLNSSCRNYNDEYTMSLQNLRMGWRIVNTKSMIEEYLNSTYFTYHLYNGSVINKQKNKESSSKQKKKINLKQMKNIYKVFFNQSILFNTKKNKNSKIFQSIKKKDEVNDYVLNQSHINSIRKDQSLSIPNQKFRNESSENGIKIQNQRSSKYRGSHKLKPCFFKETYKPQEDKINTRICQKIKCEKVSKSLYCKSVNFSVKNKAETKPNSVEPEEDNFQMNQVFGKGATIIQIRNLKIETCSTIKKDDLLVLELMGKNGHIATKGVLTPPIKYCEIESGIKFAFDTKASDFVPLKIWKYHGINLVELGIIDLNLLVFRNRKKYFEMEKKLQSQVFSDGIQQIQLYRQERQRVGNNKKQERDILFYHTKEKLRKNKKAQIEVTVSMNCLIYNKKFNRLKTNFTDLEDKENMVLENSSESK